MRGMNLTILRYQGCFALSGIFRAEQNSSLYVSSQAELIRRRQRKIPLRAEYSAEWKTAFNVCSVVRIEK